MSKDYSAKVDLSFENSSHTKMIAMCGSDKTVLDVGCHSGGLAAALAERGCVVAGVELDPAAAARAALVCDRVVVGDLDTIDLRREFGDTRFDVILFGDVLEHLKSPQTTLIQARGLLAPGGFVAASVPNIAHATIRLMLLKGEFNYENMGILDDTHLRFFTMKSVRDLFEGSGYIVDSMDWTEWRLPEESLKEALDPLGINDISGIAEAFAAPDAVAFQYVVKAFAATEEAQVRTLSEQKVSAERRVAELERDMVGLKNVAESSTDVMARYQKTVESYRQLEEEIEMRGERLKVVEEQLRLHDAEVATRDRYIRELEERLADSHNETWRARSEALGLREELQMRFTARLRRRLGRGAKNTEQ